MKHTSDRWWWRGPLFTLLLVLGAWIWLRETVQSVPADGQQVALAAGGSQLAAELRTAGPRAQFAFARGLRAKGARLSPEELAAAWELVQEPLENLQARNDLAEAILVAGDPGQWRHWYAQAQEANESAVWRDYAVQFLGIAARRADEPAGVGLALETLIAQPETGLAGTALLGLSDWFEHGGAVSRETLVQHITNLALNTAYQSAARMAAVQLAAHHQVHTLTPALRELVTNVNTETHLRRSAIAALGSLGSAEDAARLEPWTHDPFPPLAAAARAALARLQP